MELLALLGELFGLCCCQGGQYWQEEQRMSAGQQSGCRLLGEWLWSETDLARDGRLLCSVEALPMWCFSAWYLLFYNNCVFCKKWGNLIATRQRYSREDFRTSPLRNPGDCTELSPSVNYEFVSETKALRGFNHPANPGHKSTAFLQRTTDPA